jgi:hypothetical protein
MADGEADHVLPPTARGETVQSNRIIALNQYFDFVKKLDEELYEESGLDIDDVITTLHADERIIERFSDSENQDRLDRSLRATVNRRFFISRRSTIRLAMPDGEFVDFIFSADLQMFISSHPVSGRVGKFATSILPLPGLLREWTDDDVSLVEHIMLNNEERKGNGKHLSLPDKFCEQLRKSKESGARIWTNHETICLLVVSKGDDDITTRFVFNKNMNKLITVYQETKFSFSKWKEVRQRTGHAPRREYISPVVRPASSSFAPDDNVRRNTPANSVHTSSVGSLQAALSSAPAATFISSAGVSRIVTSAVATAAFECAWVNAKGNKSVRCNKKLERESSCRQCFAVFCSTSCMAKHKKAGCTAQHIK